MIKKIFSVCLMLLFMLNATYSQSDSTAYLKGIAAANDGNYTEAVDLFSQAISDNPIDVYARYNRGLAFSMLNLQDSAISDMSKAIELDPNYTKAYLIRGISKRKIADFNGAQLDFKQAIINQPNYAEAYYHRGYIFEMFGNRDSACQFYQKAYDFGLKQAENRIEICNDAKRDFNKHILFLEKYSDSKKYGYSEKNPIKVGGSPTNQHEYLNLLRDVNNKPIKYRRIGSCCHYKSKSAPMGMGLLDKYEIFYTDDKGLSKSAIVYITFYEYEEPHVIMGFKTIDKK